MLKQTNAAEQLVQFQFNPLIRNHRYHKMLELGQPTTTSADPQPQMNIARPREGERLAQSHAACWEESWDLKPCGFIEANKHLVCTQRVKPFVVGEEAKAVYRADRHTQLWQTLQMPIVTESFAFIRTFESSP